MRKPTTKEITESVLRTGEIASAWVDEERNLFDDVYQREDDPDALYEFLGAGEVAGLIEMQATAGGRGPDDVTIYRFVDPAGKFHRLEIPLAGFVDAVRALMPNMPHAREWRFAREKKEANAPVLELWMEQLRRGRPLPAGRFEDARREWRVSKDGLRMWDVVRRMVSEDVAVSITTREQDRQELEGRGNRYRPDETAHEVRLVVPEAPLEMVEGPAGIPARWHNHPDSHLPNMGCATCGEPTSHSILKRCWAVGEVHFGELVLFSTCPAHGRFLVRYAALHHVPLCVQCGDPVTIDLEPEYQPAEANSYATTCQTSCHCGGSGGRVRMGPVEVGPDFDRWVDRDDVEALRDLLAPFQVDETLEVEIGAERDDGTEVRLGPMVGFCPESLASIREPTCLVKILRFDLVTNELVVSHAAIAREERANGSASLTEGQQARGVVTLVTPFGVLLDIDGTEALLHITELPHAQPDTLTTSYETGQTLDVEIAAIADGRVMVRPRPAPA